MTICVSSASDETKLPLMIVFKGEPGGRTEKSINDELPDRTFGCCGEKGWIDERSCRVWLEKIWLPHVDGSMDETLLLLDEFSCHIQQAFINKLADAGTEVEFIHGGYTSVPQPCDVGVKRPFKKHILEQYTKWAVRMLKYVDTAAIVPDQAGICGHCVS
uniref:PREDICTED: pogo transposable element with KRAB domainlike putative n=1 Tax=Albugo laibachii Nc14 TaxID=890382 RepID=F0WDH7_9STRA|nr:PREDICTED: pogo transposable element with KRAB domainlike putative [Albugo laibachii Nc14]|eukprot:CCA19249.1 PREDICTED: pogo transposable element with KRAB domainlike putative [Albugo laibachii Nc14]